MSVNLLPTLSRTHNRREQERPRGLSLADIHFHKEATSLLDIAKPLHQLKIANYTRSDDT